MLGVIVVGTLGYEFIEGYSLLDAFYMTLITVSTVGYGEVTPLSPEGKIFTAFLILICFGTFAYAISSITSYLASGEYKEYVRELKKHRKVQKLKDHIIVCGFGRVGRQVSAELRQSNEKFVVVESNKDRFTLNEVREGFMPIFGDATRDEILEQAGLKRAKAVVTTLPNDADNLYVVLAAREINPKVKIISRASRFGSVKKMRSAGASNVIMPDTLGGAHMALLVIHPDTMDFIDQLSINNPDSPSLVEVDVPELGDKHVYIGDVKNLVSNVAVLGIKHRSGEMEVNPHDRTAVQEGDKLFVIAEADILEDFKKALKAKA